ncbi:UNVERIFIED_CONTAM: hypothetical protein FKN15_006912 [Acipenser sinensis]
MVFSCGEQEHLTGSNGPVVMTLQWLLELAMAVSAQILKASLDTMERQIQRLENDIKNFPKNDDDPDKFVQKMTISFLWWFSLSP